MMLVIFNTIKYKIGYIPYVKEGGIYIIEDIDPDR